MKKVNKILIICIITFIIIGFIGIIPSLAFSPDTYNPNPSADNPTFNVGISKIMGVIQFLGGIAGVLTLAIIGLKYLLTSPEGKADYKANMLPYIIGAVLLLGGSALIKLIASVV